MKDLSNHNHVVTGVGTWGRGRNIFEAMKNAKVKRKDIFQYYIFKDDTWDIDDMGNITAPKDVCIFKQDFNFK